jgi:hypothetical protein
MLACHHARRTSEAAERIIIGSSSDKDEDRV